MSRDYYIWIVPPGNGKVRRLNLSRKVVLAGSVVGLLFLGGLLHLSIDYFRVQLSRVSQALSYAKDAKRWGSLKAENEELADRLKTQSSREVEVKAYEQKLLAELGTLTSTLRQISDLGVLPKERIPRLEGRRAKKGEDLGVGGPESGDSGEFVDLSPTANSGTLSDSGLGSLAGVETIGQTAELLRELNEVVRHLPLVAPGRGKFTSGYEVRTSPFSGKLQFHRGLDISVKHGTPVKVSGAGKVTAAGWREGYGMVVDVEHFAGVITRYGHLSAISVRTGQQVTQGQEIGKAGSTGRSTGPHIHYEIRVRNHTIDPLRMVRLAQKVGGAAGSYVRKVERRGGGAAARSREGRA